MSNVWDTPELQDGDYYSFKDVPNGTSISGTILAIETTSFTDNGVTKVVPKLRLRDDATGDDKVLTAGAHRLKSLFVEKRPNVGDHIKVTQTGSENIGGGKSVKDWSLEVNANAPATPAPAPVAAPVAQAPASTVADPAAAQAALANLTPEQLAALGLGAAPVAS